MPRPSTRSSGARAIAVLLTVLVAGSIVVAATMASSRHTDPPAAGEPGSTLMASVPSATANALNRRVAAQQAVRAAAIQSARAADFDVKPGDKGPHVRALQTRLVALRMLRTDQADGSYGDATSAAVMAFQKAQGLDRDGVTGPETRLALAKEDPAPPKPFTDGGGDRVEVSLSKQLVQLVHDGAVRRVISVSTGKPGHDTPTGRFAVYEKNPNAYSYTYDAPMPLASFFTGSYGLHQSADVPGYPASHGCVRIPASFAPEVYDFAGMGMPVVVVA